MGATDARIAYCAVLDRVFPGWDGGATATMTKKRQEVGAALFEDDGAHEARTTKHEFWDKQPMPNKWYSNAGTDELQLSAQREAPEMIDNQIAVNVSHEPLALPPHLEWCDDEWTTAPLAAICEAVHQLSCECADEDGGGVMFMPSAKFLQWSMNPPAMKREWLVGFRQKVDTHPILS